MRLTDYENEDALDLLIGILEPSTKIFSDEKVKKLFSDKKASKLSIIKDIIKFHKKEIIEILAAMEGKDFKQYKGNIVTMTQQILDIFNDPVMNDFFSSQVQMLANASSGQHTENIEESEE